MQSDEMNAVPSSSKLTDRSESDREDMGDAESNHSKKRVMHITKGKRASTKPTPGIIYISRLPPGMTPQKVKHLMSTYGDVGRVYAQRKDGESLRASQLVTNVVLTTESWQLPRNR
jgi:hypothetical protein